MQRKRVRLGKKVGDKIIRGNTNVTSVGLLAPIGGTEF